MNLQLKKVSKNRKDHILDLFSRVYKPAVMKPEEYEWKYEKNPNGNVYTYFALHNEKVVGSVGYFPWAIMVNQEERLFYFSGDGMIDPQYQRKGIVQKIYKMAFDDLGQHEIAGMLGFTNEINTKASLKAGWQKLCDLITLVKVLNWSFFIYNKIIKVESVKLLFTAFSKIEELIRKFKKKNILLTLYVKKEFDEQVDELFRKFIRNEGQNLIIVKRNRKYLNWKYTSNPNHKHYICYFYDPNKELVGYTVYRKQHKEAIISDLLVYKDFEQECIECLERYLRQQNFYSLRGAFGFGTSYIQKMKESGFRIRKKPFTVIVKDVGKYNSEEIKEKNRWFFTLGDTDVG